jgi:hypothetical protein
LLTVRGLCCAWVRAAQSVGAFMLMVVVAVVQHAERVLLVQEAKPSVRGHRTFPAGA